MIMFQKEIPGRTHDGDVFSQQKLRAFVIPAKLNQVENMSTTAVIPESRKVFFLHRDGGKFQGEEVIIMLWYTTKYRMTENLCDIVENLGRIRGGKSKVNVLQL